MQSTYNKSDMQSTYNKSDMQYTYNKSDMQYTYNKSDMQYTYNKYDMQYTYNKSDMQYTYNMSDIWKKLYSQWYNMAYITLVKWYKMNILIKVLLYTEHCQTTSLQASYSTILHPAMCDTTLFASKQSACTVSFPRCGLLTM